MTIARARARCRCSMSMCLIMNNGYLKLADMGLCKYLPGDNVTYTMCGTPTCARSSSSDSDMGTTMAVDWWAYGCLSCSRCREETRSQMLT